MEKIIETVIGIILVLGLIAYAILGQVSGVKDTGDKAQVEQAKINQMLSSSDIVTGATVRNYVDIVPGIKGPGGTSAAVTGILGAKVKEGTAVAGDVPIEDKRLHVCIFNRDASTGDKICISAEYAGENANKSQLKALIKENALYSTVKDYHPDGNLWVITFTQENLSGSR